MRDQKGGEMRLREGYAIAAPVQVDGAQLEPIEKQYWAGQPAVDLGGCFRQTCIRPGDLLRQCSDAIGS